MTGPTPNPPQAPRRALFLFDAQNVFKGTKDVFGATRWRTDAKKMAHSVADRLGLFVHEIRFYTGIPKWDRHYDMRAFWERKLDDLRADGIITEFRQLHYKGAADRSGREKGIDVLIALDAMLAVIDGDVTDIVIFSQDNDLREIPDRAQKALDREATRTGVRRTVNFYSAYAYDPVKEAATRAWVEGQGERPRANYRGITGMQWVKLSRTDFEACVDEREVALDAQKVDLPAELQRLAKKHHKRVTEDYDVSASGGGYISGRVAGVFRLPARGVVVFETTADLLAVKVCNGCLPQFEGTLGKTTRAQVQMVNGEVYLAVTGVDA